MCEPATARINAWDGWPDLPAPDIGSGLGAWVDLAHAITEDLSRAPMFPQPRIRKLISIPETVINLTEMHMVCHHGTHIDAPCHFIADGPTIDQIPLERLYGQGVVWRIDVGAYGVIEPAHLEAATPRMQPGDMVLLDTGSAQHVNTPKYEQHAALSEAAAAWLVDRGAKLVGIDCSTPDLTSHKRPHGFNWPVHHILLSRGTLIAEHVTNIRDLSGHRIEAMFMALNIAGSDGAPTRVVARALAN